MATTSITLADIAHLHMSDSENAGFLHLYDRFQKQGPPIRWEAIEAPAVVLYENLESVDAALKLELLKKVAVVKLNGGLGTTMGCTGPKSAIPVCDGKTFLELTVLQVQHLNEEFKGADVPVILMNSFNTEHETKALLAKFPTQTRVEHFNQSCYPRIWKDPHKFTFKVAAEKPLTATDEHSPENEHWFPPGHGDVYESLRRAGILEDLLKEGREYVFISNIDNLGATVDFRILNHIVQNQLQFVVEVTDKTNADIKGGTLIKHDGKVKLLEVAQVPKEHLDEFKSVRKFKIFNTNNLWAHVPSVLQKLQDNELNMDIIVNEKKLREQPVIQLEMAAGSAVQCFKRAIGVNVPRRRFLPVKGTSDLLLVQSNLYTLEADGSMLLNNLRPYETLPVVKLGKQMQHVGPFQKRVGGALNIVELDHLTVSGDVTIEAGTILRGTVIIVAPAGTKINISNAKPLENKVITAKPDGSTQEEDYI